MVTPPALLALRRSAKSSLTSATTRANGERGGYTEGTYDIQRPGETNEYLRECCGENCAGGATCEAGCVGDGLSRNICWLNHCLHSACRHICGLECRQVAQRVEGAMQHGAPKGGIDREQGERNESERFSACKARIHDWWNKGQYT